jgi:epoxyqueuosine reductase
MTNSVRENIKIEARELGFDLVGFASAKDFNTTAPHAKDGLTSFLDKEWYGDMDWFVEKADRRIHPNALWDECKTVIMVGMNYCPADSNNDPLTPLHNLNNPQIGNLSVYARGRDYHDVVKKRIKQLARSIHQAHDVAVKVFVDTAPVMEKPLAQAAGIGWQGKHTNLVSREIGSWFFLAALYTTLEIEPDAPHVDTCGECRACLDACPTNAFPEPNKLDARRCISYLTIEHKGHIDEEFRKAMDNRIYGCDDCLAACPWNKFAQTSREVKLKAKEHLIAPKLADFLEMDDAAFREFFTASPIKRTGRDRFMRNVLIACGNSGDETFIPAVKKHLSDPNPIIRAMAIWALKQLMNDGEFEALKAEHFGAEVDKSVMAEWG